METNEKRVGETRRFFPQRFPCHPDPLHPRLRARCLQSDKSILLPSYNLIDPNPYTPQLQSDKSILNPSFPSKEPYPSSAQEGSGGQVRPPVELQEPTVFQSPVFLPPLELQSSILRPSVVVLQEQFLLQMLALIHYG
ncbi:hypothetical protein PVAP13_9NG430970 [Panicum virgatum]|uniref:Uncharacterized protein n=1 Tax=Panicum virgatum TaxID=38727 RepID=A0A8T0MN68_PANVG|nr:hypothetical protein PVAP13_9NG430970 [Panicum virgatum]